MHVYLYYLQLVRRVQSIFCCWWCENQFDRLCLTKPLFNSMRSDFLGSRIIPFSWQEVTTSLQPWLANAPRAGADLLSSSGTFSCFASCYFGFLGQRSHKMWHDHVTWPWITSWLYNSSSVQLAKKARTPHVFFHWLAIMLMSKARAR